MNQIDQQSAPEPGSQEGLRPLQVFFLLVFGAYILFPREDGLKTVGLGAEGARILFLDVFVLIVLIGHAALYRHSLKETLSVTGRVPWLLFGGTVLYSLLRGLPAFGGMALGESRWFFCAALVPVGYTLYNERFGRLLQRTLVVAALFHALVASVQMATGQSWDESEEIRRFAGGREALVIAMGILSLVDMRARAAWRGDGSWWGLMAFFASMLLVIQTRSLFLMLPVILLVYAAFRSETVGTLLKSAAIGIVTVFVVTSFIVAVVVPRDVASSIRASAEVAIEGFSPAAWEFVMNPGDFTPAAAEGFSAAGNTAFRLMAWSQVVTALDEAPGGWFVGLPMGSGFLFFDPSGYLWENLEPHNDYLSIVSKIGLVGFAGYTLFLVLLLRFALRARREDLSIFLLGQAPFLVCIVLLISVYGSLNAEMRTYGTHFWIWPLIGIAIRSLERLQLPLVPTRGDAPEAPDGGGGKRE